MYRGISLNYLLGRFGNSLLSLQGLTHEDDILKPGYRALVSGSTEGNSSYPGKVLAMGLVLRRPSL